MTPTATYRLQLHKDFTFADAAAQTDYLAALGISHVYASPILTARKGSMHGYDVVDHARINPELGGEEGFRAMATALRAKGLGIILDIVPNHMAVGKDDNTWWLDVLARGLDSPHARSFDIDWDTPGMEGKVLAPFLGKTPQQALDDGELTLVRGDPGLAFAYFDHVFPLRPQDQDLVPETLDRQEVLGLLARQHYVLAHWRAADKRINWRRFFDITDLAAIRVGEPDVFEAVHAKVFSLYAEGLIDGVRVDHVDGIADPGAYCRRLRARLDGLRPGAYIIVEKILAEGEALPRNWQVDGTTGYDFLNEVSALLHGDDAGLLTALWKSQSGRAHDFDAEEIIARGEILERKFAAQLNAAARGFAALLEYSPPQMRACLAAILVRLRCYRSYANGQANSPGAGPFLLQAVAQAQDALPDQARTLQQIADLFERRDGASPVVDALRRFSQLSAPVAAKSVEDTAFYRYGRLLSRNDVGCNPGRARLAVEDFHTRMAARATDWPKAMLATATHDHKRGEDARMRLAALSHYPEAWAEFLARTVQDVPDDLNRGDVYQLLQTLYAAWPQRQERDFTTRIQGWCGKFLREGKLRSDWADPNEAYENRFTAFAAELTQTCATGLDTLAASTTAWSDDASLVQLVLRYTLPGIPDMYQGCELEDFSLVDPDNRRPVDFKRHREELNTLGNRKMRALARLLQERKDCPELFMSGDYRSVELASSHAIAFIRSTPLRQMWVMARLSPAPLEGAISLTHSAKDIFTDRAFDTGPNSIAMILDETPAAVLISAA